MRQKRQKKSDAVEHETRSVGKEARESMNLLQRLGAVPLFNSWTRRTALRLAILLTVTLFVSTLTGCSLFNPDRKNSDEKVVLGTGIHLLQHLDEFYVPSESTAGSATVENQTGSRVRLNNQNAWEQIVYEKVKYIRDGLSGLGVLVPKSYALTTYKGPGFWFRLPQRAVLVLNNREGDNESGFLYFLDRKRAFDLYLTWVGFLPLNVGERVVAGTDILLLQHLDEFYAASKSKVFRETELAKQFTAWQRETGLKTVVSKLGGWTEGETGEVTFARTYSEQGDRRWMGFAVSWYSGTPESGRVFTLICRFDSSQVAAVTSKGVSWPSLENDSAFNLATLVLGSFREGKN
jgi:hypothetical protein